MNIVPSILTSSYEELHRQVNLIKDSVDWLQLDVADGLFVNNKTVPLRNIPETEFSGLSIEAHLMVKNPESYFADCLRLGIARAIIHFEAVDDIKPVIDKLKSMKVQAAVALNPSTEVSRVENFIDDLDSLLLLSVEPGRQGQKFISEVLSKIAQIRLVNPDIIIGLDGGINLTNIEKVSAHRPDYVSIGSALWQSPDPVQALQELKSRVDAAGSEDSE